jgi:hypothetical protein
MKHQKLIIIGIICLLLGFFVGYTVGFAGGLGWAFNKAMVLMDKQGIKLTFDENMITMGLLQYKDNIGGCLFVDAINKTGN